MSVPARPVIEIMLDEHGRGSVDGRPVPIDDPDDPQASLLAEAVRQAAKLSRPVRVRALDPDGVWHLAAHPDGTVTELTDDLLVADEVPQATSDGDTTWHLRVHPSGEIIALDDEPDEDVDHVPTTGGAAPSVPSPSRAPDAAYWVTEPDAEVDPEPAPEPEAAAEPGPQVTGGPEPLAPEAARPDVIEPDGVEPDFAEPEFLEPDFAEPEFLEPESVEPELVEPELVEPELVEPEAARPGPVEPELVIESVVVAPDPGPGPSPQPEGIVPWLNAPTLLGTPGPQAPGHRSGTDPGGDADLDLDEPAGHRGDAAALLGDLRSGPPGPPAPRRPLTRWVRPAAMVGAGVLVAGALGYALLDRTGPAPSAVAVAGDQGSGAQPSQTAGGTVSSAAAQEPPPAAVPAPSTVRPPASLAAAPPPGFRNAPAWAVPISSAATSVVSADGRVLTLTADGQVALVDPQTGRIRWHVPAPGGATGPHLARIDGKDVAAVMTADRLTYWPLPAAGAADRVAAAAGTSIDLPPGTAVSWAGPSPLLVLGDGAAAVVRERTIQRANLPTGMKPLAADSADVLAWSGRHWIRQGAGQAAGTPKSFAPPEGATGAAPVRVENVGGSFLGTMWEGSAGPVVAVYDAHGGAMVVHTTFPKDVDFARAPAVREVGSERTVVGSALFEPAQHNLSILAPTFTPVAITPGHVYADDVSGVVADLQIKGKELKVVPFKGKNPIVPVGITTAPTPVAVVATPRGSGWLLCGLPAG